VRQVEHRPDVDVEHLIPLIEAQLMDRSGVAEARVVDQDIHLCGAGGEPLEVRAIACVGGHGFRAHAVGAASLSNGVQIRLAARREH
jgi:hypothetical protein